MTFCKLLKEATLPNGDAVQAYQNTEKFESVSTYQIIIARGSIAHDVIPCARTTWKRKFAELTQG